MASENQNYDNLIGGEFPVVTERVTIASGASLKRGTILGVVTASGKYTAADATDTGQSATGTADPKAILLEDAAAASADVSNVLVALTGEFNSAKLIAKTGSTVAGFKNALRALCIFQKTVI